jgi:hypothetical protein
VVVALAGVFGDFEAEGAIERGEVGQTMRLEERVGLEVAVFDFVEWTRAARGVAEGREVGIVESRSRVSGERR